MAQPTIEDAIRDTATGPARASGDGHSVDAQDISKQIEADRYLGGKAAGAAKKTGLRIFLIRGNGAQ